MKREFWVVSNRHRVFCPPPVDRTLEERLSPFVGMALPFLSAGNPPFGGSNLLVEEVGADFIRVQDADPAGTPLTFRFFERPLVFFIVGFTGEEPPVIGRVHVNIADAELNELFEFDVDLLEIGRDYIEVIVAFRRALIPISPFLDFICVEDGPEE